MNHDKPTAIRADDLLRHLQDLRTGTYEGVQSRSEKEDLYRRGIELLRPVAVAILEEANTMFLRGSGDIQVIGTEDDGSGGLEARFELSWPEQRAAQVTRGPLGPLQPVRIIVNYSTSLEVARATGRFKSQVKLMLRGRKAYSPPLSNWSCTSASLKRTGV